MLSMKSLVEALGGRKVLKCRIEKLDDLREAAKSGLPYASLETVIGKLRLGREEAATVLRLPQRTIARRKKQQRLQADESDRVLRLARIGAQASATLGTEEKAAQWLRRPNRALGHRTPLELLDNDIGSRQVEEILARMEHGNVS
jgi:putative toxin-antitoxin system antitoxin component (TIGR02293 family)